MLSGGFLKKELRELFKTKRILILPSLFLFFAITSPIFAKYTNELIKLASEGIEISGMKDPVYYDAYGQFIKNMTQVGVIVIILMLMGMIVDEKNRGTAILVLTKRLTRTSFIISKLISAALLFTASFLISMAVCCYYTYLLFGEFYNTNLWLFIFMFWLYGMFIITMTLFASTVSKSHISSAVLAFIGFAAAAAWGSIPYIKKFSPSYLNTVGMQILAMPQKTGEIALPVLSTVLISILFVSASIVLFNKQEL